MQVQNLEVYHILSIAELAIALAIVFSMEKVGKTSKETAGIYQMNGRHNFIHHEWAETKLCMEEIVFDFLCLEDDIIEDLCKDFPAANNYQRYAVAQSFDFDRRKLSKLQSSQGSAVTGTLGGTSTQPMQPAADSGNAFDISKPMVLSFVGKDNGNVLGSMQQNRTNPNRDSDKRCSGTNDNSTIVKTKSDMRERESGDPIVLNYEQLSEDGREGEEENSGLSDTMKIKIVLLENFGIRDGLGSEKNDQGDDTYDTEPRTTKIRLRVPKSIIDSEEESLRKFILNRIKERYDRVVPKTNDIGVNLLNEQDIRS